MTDDPSNTNSTQSIRDQLWAHAIPYKPGDMPRAVPVAQEQGQDVEVDTSLIEKAAKAMWAELQECSAMSGGETLTITLPAPEDTEAEISVDAADLPLDARSDLLTKAATLAALLFELPLTQQLALTFMISSNGTLEFTSVLESYLDNFDPDSADDLPGFFVDFARRMTSAAAAAPRGDECAMKTYVVSCRVGGENLNTAVPAASAGEAARAFGAIMDICFFQEGTFERIEAVQLQGAFVDWRS